MSPADTSALWPELDDLAATLGPVDPWHVGVDWSAALSFALDDLADGIDKENRRAAWRANPAGWAADRGIELWSAQREILNAVADHNRIAVRSCHSSGKTTSMAVLTAYWLDVHPPGEARVISTAPTGDQVRGLLWNEINALWRRIPDLPGRVNQTEAWIDGYQAGIGRKSSDYKPAAFAGFHARHLLVIVDEADGVPATLWEAIDTLATNVGAVIVGIGNPDDPTSEFRKRQSDQGYGGIYHTIKIPAWRTPNFSGEPVSQLLRDVLLSQGWVEEKRLSWGGGRNAEPGSPEWVPDHPFWSSKVEAEYPDEAANAVIRVADLVRARRGVEAGSAAAERAARHGITVGIDLAGSDTGDETVVRGRRGNRLLGQETVRIADPVELEKWLLRQVTTFAASAAHVDADGIGHGYAGMLRQKARGCVVTPIRSAVAANNSEAYANRRAEMWWELREALRKTGDDQLDFSQVDDDTAAQLLVPRYLKAKGKILVESKDDIRKRIGRSPDYADAVVYAFAGGGPRPRVRVLGA